MKVQSYRDLIVWQKARKLVKEVYLTSRRFPKDELYGLTSQMRRCSVSIPSNIAEGQGKRTTGEFLQHLGHARGSLFELETQIILAGDLEFCSEKRANELLSMAEEVRKILHGLIASLTHPSPPTTRHS